MNLFKASCSDDLWAQVALMISLAHPDSTAGGGGGSRQQLDYVLCQLQTYLLSDEGVVFCDDKDDRYIAFRTNEYFLLRIRNALEPCPDMRVFFDILFVHPDRSTDKTIIPSPMESSKSVVVYEDEDGIQTVVGKTWSLFPSV